MLSVLDKYVGNKDILLYIRNTGWLLTEKILGLGAALFISVLTAKHLGPEKFGQLSFAQSFATLFVAFAALGLQRILERDLVDRALDRQQVVSSAFFLVLIGGALAYSIMYFFLQSRDYDEISEGLILIIGLTSFLQVNTVFLANFLSQVNAKPFVISNVIALSFSNVAKILFIYYDLPLYFFAFSFVLDGLLLLPILLFITFNTNSQPKLAMFSFGTAWQLLKNSWPYIITGVLITVYMKIDIIMLKEILGDYEVGQYSAAARLSEGLYYIAVTIVSSLYPSIVRAKKLGENVYNIRLKNLYSLLFYLAFALSILITFNSSLIISLLYGDEFKPASIVLSIHVWAGVFVFLSMGSGRWLLTENLQLFSVANTFVGVIINVLLNYLLIPIYGIEGAAVATVVSYAASGYFCFAFWNSTRPNFILMSKSILRFPKIFL